MIFFQESLCFAEVLDLSYFIWAISAQKLRQKSELYFQVS